MIFWLSLTTNKPSLNRPLSKGGQIDIAFLLTEFKRITLLPSIDGKHAPLRLHVYENCQTILLRTTIGRIITQLLAHKLNPFGRIVQLITTDNFIFPNKVLTDRFLKLQKAAKEKPNTHFYKFRKMRDEEAVIFARKIWNRVNLVNLIQNIAPTKHRSNVIMEKGLDHSIEKISVRNTL